MKIDRRKFLKDSAAAAALAGIGKWSPASAAPKDRPNIIVVFDDQERQPMHTPPLNLPNRDRLKKHAIEFTNAHCTYPLCSPSRATILTGKYPHEVGILTNVDFAAKNPSLSTRTPNLGRVLSEAGYHSAYFGKWHLSHRAHSRENLGKYGWDSYQVSNQLYAIGSDDKFTKHTSRWIEKSKDKAPWFLFYSPINPHDICFPFLENFYRGHRNYPVKLPPNFSPRKSPDIKTAGEFTEFKWQRLMMPKNEREWLDYLRYYCFLIEDVDRNLGVVLDALEESGQWDNTVVIFTSDHGEMGSSHGLYGKGPTMYEEAMNIPLWISDPRRMTGFRQCDSMVSNLDLVPTVCAIAGVQWPERLRGVDLNPTIEGAEQIERDHLFAEGALRKSVAWRGVRTREWKYWHYTNGEEALFNIKDDPFEMKNLATDPEAKDMLVGFRNRVRKWRRGTGDPLKDFLD